MFCMHVCLVPTEVKKRTSDPLKMELQMFGTLQEQVLLTVKSFLQSHDNSQFLILGVLYFVLCYCYCTCCFVLF